MDTWRPLDPEDRRPGSSEGHSVPSLKKYTSDTHASGALPSSSLSLSPSLLVPPSSPPPPCRRRHRDPAPPVLRAAPARTAPSPASPPLPRRPPFPGLCADGGAYFVPIELSADTTTSALKGSRLPRPHWLGVSQASPCGPSTTCSGLDGRRTSKLAMTGISSPCPLLDSALSNATARVGGALFISFTLSIVLLLFCRLWILLCLRQM
jgi:hypothetical protein